MNIGNPEPGNEARPLEELGSAHELEPGAPHVLEEEAPAGTVGRAPDGVISRPDELVVAACAHCRYVETNETPVDAQRALSNHLASRHGVRRALVHLLGVSSAELVE